MRRRRQQSELFSERRIIQARNPYKTGPALLQRSDYMPLVEMALAEDKCRHDLTSFSLFGSEERCKARIITREPAVIAGLEIAQAVWTELSSDIQCEVFFRDGADAGAAAVVMEAHGPAAYILSGERVALNFLARMFGIATGTAAMIKAAAGTEALIVDTRKTTPGWRLLDKYAVRCGGGGNHRFDLAESAMIKDNHRFGFRGAIREATSRIREKSPDCAIILEIDSIDALNEALQAGPDVILLDNFPIRDLRRAVEYAKGKALLEASGGISIENIRSVAETGVDVISLGALTHSFRWIDLTLEII